MTAVIGVLNKTAVAIAADSAATVSGHGDRKIFNTANKIFTLSKYQPVGVAIFGGAAFMGIPWEILIKSYREQLGRRSFDRLAVYINDFIGYVKTQVHHISQETKDMAAWDFSSMVWQRLLEQGVRAKARGEGWAEPSDLNDWQKQIDQFFQPSLQDWLSHLQQYNLLVEFPDYRYEDFMQTRRNLLEEFFHNATQGLTFPSESREDFFQLVFQNLIKDEVFPSLSGLVFAGYGEADIYPTCHSVEFGELFDERIRYRLDLNSDNNISDGNTGIIRPFAQRDVIDTFLAGIDGEIDYIYKQSFATLLSNFQSTLVNQVIKQYPQVAQQLGSIDLKPIFRQLEQELNTAQQRKHIEPLMASVSLLAKEDLAEMAESLIYLTYLKRRISFTEESVGGPVDVALISKNDGFIWMKRKHYFQPELNYSFFQNYFKP